jgi:hypothetical protein
MSSRAGSRAGSSHGDESPPSRTVSGARLAPGFFSEAKPEFSRTATASAASVFRTSSSNFSRSSSDLNFRLKKQKKALPSSLVAVQSAVRMKMFRSPGEQNPAASEDAAGEPKGIQRLLREIEEMAPLPGEAPPERPDGAPSEDAFLLSGGGEGGGISIAPTGARKRAALAEAREAQARERCAALEAERAALRAALASARAAAAATAHEAASCGALAAALLADVEADGACRVLTWQSHSLLRALA